MDQPLTSHLRDKLEKQDRILHQLAQAQLEVTALLTLPIDNQPDLDPPHHDTPE